MVRQGRRCRVGDLVETMAFGLVKMKEKIMLKVLGMNKHNQVELVK